MSHLPTGLVSSKKKNSCHDFCPNLYNFLKLFQNSPYGIPRNFSSHVRTNFLKVIQNSPYGTPRNFSSHVPSLALLLNFLLLDLLLPLLSSYNHKHFMLVPLPDCEALFYLYLIYYAKAALHYYK